MTRSTSKSIRVPVACRNPSVSIKYLRRQINDMRAVFPVDLFPCYFLPSLVPGATQVYFRSVAKDPSLVGDDPRTRSTILREYMQGLGLFNRTISSSTSFALSFGCSVKYRSDLVSGANTFASLLHWRPCGIQRLHEVMCC